MDIQQLSDIGIDILDEIENQARDENVTADELVNQRMKPFCQKATEKFIKDMGKSALTYDVIAPTKIPSSDYTPITFLGMEEIVFEKFISTVKASVVCVFYYKETNQHVYIKDEWLGKVLGPRGESMQQWIKSNTDLPRVRKDILREIESRMGEDDYKEVDGYGAW